MPSVTSGLSLSQLIADAAPFLADWVDARRDQARVPGIQVAVRVGDELVFSHASGMANAETGEELRTDHLFRIASHSKTFTATSCFQLAEAGKLRLDDRVEQHLPELADSPVAQLTVRELLGHQGGVIRDGEDSDYWALARDFPDRDGVLDMARSALVFEPNHYFKYTNVGYSLLGLIIEAASGQPYADYVTQHIIDVLGLTRLGPELPESRFDEATAGHTARLRADDRVSVIPHISTKAMDAATGFYGNAEDLTAYWAAHANGRTELLSDASKRMMQRRESHITKPAERWYGLGLIIREVGERTLVGHSGGFPGHITQSWLDPKDGLSISVLTNQLGGPATELSVGLIKLIDFAAGAPEGHEIPEGIDPSSFTGRYAAMWGAEDIVHLGGRLVALPVGCGDPQGEADELTVVDADTLAPVDQAGFGGVGERIRFFRDDAGRVERIRSGGSTMWPEADYRRQAGLDPDDEPASEGVAPAVVQA